MCVCVSNSRFLYVYIYIYVYIASVALNCSLIPNIFHRSHWWRVEGGGAEIEQTNKWHTILSKPKHVCLKAEYFSVREKQVIPIHVSNRSHLYRNSEALKIIQRSLPTPNILKVSIARKTSFCNFGRNLLRNEFPEYYFAKLHKPVFERLSKFGLVAEVSQNN